MEQEKVREITDSLANIDKTLALLDQRLEVHTKQDETNFAKIEERLTELSEKVDAIRLENAAHQGELLNKKIVNKGTIINSLIISFVVIVEIIRYWVGGV